MRVPTILLLVLVLARPVAADTSRNAVWSPDGAQVVYERVRPHTLEIRIVAADGHGARLLHAFPTTPKVYCTFDILGWTPDAHAVLVSETQHVKTKEGPIPQVCLWRVPMASGAAVVPWPRGPVRGGFIPGVQGDRVCLALDGGFDWAPGAGGYENASRIQITDLDGRPQGSELRYQDDVDLIRWPWYAFGDQSNLSPDGRWVLTLRGLSLSGIDVIVRSTDGAKRRVIDTMVTLPDGTMDAGQEEYRWSSAPGDVLLGLGGSRLQLSRYHLETDTHDVLAYLPVPHLSHVTGFALSPDEKQVCFTWDYNPGHGAVHILDLGQSKVRTILVSTSEDVTVGPYAWRGDRILVWVTPQDGNTTLYAVAADGSRKVRLTP